MTFEELGLSEEVLRAVSEAGYEQPTPIQEKAIPYVLMGRDILGVAQTGTGKTASFVLPMLDIMSSGRAKARMPRSLIIEPTRELAAQVAENFEKYGKYTKLTYALLIGGESFKDQQALLERGVDVLICTPGRLIDLFERGNILLADAKTLVIDEADRMLDMGFIPDVERIVKMLPTIRQTLFFSATMAPEIRRLTEEFLLNPKEISVAPPASPAKTVRQRLVKSGAEAKDKRETLRKLIDRVEPTLQSGLIFCNRKRDVGIVHRSLVRHGYDAAELHGDMAQPARMATLDRFKKDEVRLLVCSDVAARGLDIPRVSHVFNYDVPSNAEDYVHRIGRTGRAGRSGESYTIFTRMDSKVLDAIEKLIGGKVEVEDMSKPRGSDATSPEASEAEALSQAEAASERSAPESDEGGESGRGRSRRGGRRRGGRNRRKGDERVEAQAEDRTDDRGEERPADAAEPVATDGPTAESDAEESQGGALNAAARKSAEAGAQRARKRRDDEPERQSERPADRKADRRESRRGNRDEGRRDQGRNAGEREARPGDPKPLPPEFQDTAFGDHVPAFLMKPVPQVANG